MPGQAFDTGFSAGQRPEIGPRLLGMAHELVEAPLLSPGNDKVRTVGLAAVSELKTLAALQDLGGTEFCETDLPAPAQS